MKPNKKSIIEQELEKYLEHRHFGQDKTLCEFCVVLKILQKARDELKKRKFLVELDDSDIIDEHYEDVVKWSDIIEILGEE